MTQYTKRDHETMQVLGKHETGDGERFQITNRVLAQELGVTAGAAVPRLFRLHRLGLLTISYDLSDKGNGRVENRWISILEIPPAPYVQEKKASKETAPEAPVSLPEETPVGETGDPTATPETAAEAPQMDEWEYAVDVVGGDDPKSVFAQAASYDPDTTF